MRDFLYKIIQFRWIKPLFWTNNRKEPERTSGKTNRRDIMSASQAAQQILNRKFDRHK